MKETIEETTFVLHIAQNHDNQDFHQLEILQ